MADTAVPTDGGERTVDVLNADVPRPSGDGRCGPPRPPSRLSPRLPWSPSPRAGSGRRALACLAALALGGCGAGEGSGEAAAGGEVPGAGAAAALGEALAALRAREEGGRSEPGNGPAGELASGAAEAGATEGSASGFHPRARAESTELVAVLRDGEGRRYGFSRRFDRFALRAPEDGTLVDGTDFGFRDVVRLTGSLDAGAPAGAAGAAARREALERVTLGLAEASRHVTRVRDSTLTIGSSLSGASGTIEPPASGARGADTAAGATRGEAAASGAARCVAEHRLEEGDGLTLRFGRQGCPHLVDAGALIVTTSPTLAVGGTLVVDGVPHEVDGRGWVRRAWGDLPAPGGAVVFDRLLLDLDGAGLVDATRSKRRSGRGPRTTTASLRPHEAAGGTRELSAPRWRDGAAAGVRDGEGDGTDAGVRGGQALAGSATSSAAVPSAWTLRVPSAGIDVVLEPLVAVAPLSDLAGSLWRGAVSARGSHEGIGFVEHLLVGAEGSVTP